MCIAECAPTNLKINQAYACDNNSSVLAGIQRKIVFRKLTMKDDYFNLVLCSRKATLQKLPKAISRRLCRFCRQLGRDRRRDRRHLESERNTADHLFVQSAQVTLPCPQDPLRHLRNVQALGDPGKTLEKIIRKKQTDLHIKEKRSRQKLEKKGS